MLILFIMFKKFINHSIINFFNTLFYDNKSNSIIDPFTCLIRLAVLVFKPEHTKLSIKNNKISYNDPHLLQGTIRWTNGDNREDIHNIYNPIIKALQWYDLENDDIKNIFKYAIKGLEKLKESYDENSTITHSIEYYISYIKTNLKQKKNNYQETNSIFIQFKELWNDREINIINNMLLELNENDESKDSLIDAIEVILNNKENIVADILLQNTTKLE